MMRAGKDNLAIPFIGWRKQKGLNRGRLLKKTGLLTRPTPARRDAPFREQGRSE
jgi:hypothetical protein